MKINTNLQTLIDQLDVLTGPAFSRVFRDLAFNIKLIPDPVERKAQALAVASVCQKKSESFAKTSFLVACNLQGQTEDYDF